MRKDVLAIDADAQIERIAQSLRAQVLGEFRRRGAVLGSRHTHPIVLKLL